MTSATTVDVGRKRPFGWLFGLGLAAIFALAVAVRLARRVRGAGLYGLGNYDDGVHFAAALGLVNGLLPYRDFLLLHPPGVVLALAPFAALSWLIGEPDAMAVARLSWMLLGGVNAVLCGLVLRPVSRVAGLVAALFYALSIGAVYVRAHHLAGAAGHHRAAARSGDHPTAGIGRPASAPGTTSLAGLLLGLSPVLKIWGVVAVLVVVGGDPGPAGPAARAGHAGSCGRVVRGRVPAVLPRRPAGDVADGGGRPARPTPRRTSGCAERLDDVLGVREWTGGSGQWNRGSSSCSPSCWRATRDLPGPGRAPGDRRPDDHPRCLGDDHADVVPALRRADGGTDGPDPRRRPGRADWGGRGSIRWLPPTLAGIAVAGILVLGYPMRDVQLGDKQFPGAQLGAAAAEWDGCTHHRLADDPDPDGPAADRDRSAAAGSWSTWAATATT